MTGNLCINTMIVIAAALISLGCSEERRASPILDPAALDQDRAFAEVRRLLQLGSRDSGTEGAQRAAEHLRDRLAAVGVAAEIDSFEDDTPRGKLLFHNVTANIPGDGPGLVIIGSHFDTKAGMPSGFQGANDSGSSTGLLIELARVIAAAPSLGYDVKLAFFDGEECLESYSENDGLHGSRRLVDRLIESGRTRDVKAVLILDMIGDRNLDIRIPANTDARLASMTFKAAAELGVRDKFGLSGKSIIDDHLPFHQAGMPALNLIDFNYGSRPGLNDYWHTGADTIDKIAPASLGITGRVVLKLLNSLDK